MKRRSFLKAIIAAPFVLFAGAWGAKVASECRPAERPLVGYFIKGAGGGNWHYVYHDPRLQITYYDDSTYLDLSVKANRQLVLDAAQIIPDRRTSHEA